MTKSKNIRLIKLSAFLSGMGFFRAVMSIYFVSKGVGLEHILYSQTLYSIINLAAEVPTGIVGDKFSHRQSVLVGRFMSILPYLMYIFMPNIYGLYLSFIIFGVGDAFTSGSEEAFIHSSSEHGSFKKNISGVMSNEVFGGVIGTAASGFMYWLLGTGGFVVLLGLNAFTRLLSAYVFTRTKPLIVSEADLKQLKMVQILRTALKQIWRNTTLRSLTIVKMLTLGAQYVLYGIYAPYFTENNVQPVFIGLVLTFGLLSNGLVVRNIHKLERYISIEKTVLILPIIMSATYLLFSIVHNPWLLVGVFIMLQAQFNLLDPVLSDYINYEAEPKSRSTILSAVSTISTLANAISKFALGLVLASGGVALMFRVQAAYLVVGGILSWWLLKRCGCVYVLPKSAPVVE